MSVESNEERGASERRSPEQALIAQNRVLQRIATGAPLGEVLGEIVRLVEAQLPGSLCSVLIRDAASGLLRFGAGASLPAAYNEAIDGVAIGPEVGSCGTAAHRGQTVVVRDIATDPLWRAFRHIALDHGLRACVSVPIFSGNRRSADGVLGTFALYSRSSLAPDAAFDETALAGAAHLAGVAIEREHQVRELRESEERFRVLVDGVRDYAIFLAGPSGHVITWSSAAERIFGYAPREALGKHLEEFYPREDRLQRRAQAYLERAAREGHCETEGWRVRKDGQSFWASALTTSLRSPDGSIRGFAKVVRDLTEPRRLEEQLRQAQKMEAIGRLAGGVAHDFNNLLTVINGFSEVLLGAVPPGHPMHEPAAAIRDAGERAAALTGQLLAFSRRAMIEPRILGMDEAIEATAKLLVRLIGEDVELACRLGAPGATVLVDRGQFEQVLVNLAINARDAMPDGGTLTISTARVARAPASSGEPGELAPGEYVEICIADSGSGMTEAVRQRVFEPFFTTKGIGKGTGLGLAMVYGVVKQAGGAISVESTPGSGSCFRVLLPLAGDSPQAVAELEVRAAPHGCETILLAEDEAAVRRLARLTLEQHGYVVIEGASGRQALRAAEERGGRIELLLTDVVMPDGNGRELAAAVRARWPDARVLYMSGYTDDSAIRDSLEAAAGGFLRKPFTPSSLARKVREALDARQ